jgi:hypothetical protein
VTKPYAKSEMPDMLTEQDAVWGTYTTPLDGIEPKESVQLSFVAQEPGSYYLACARGKHFKLGQQWIGLEIRNRLEQAGAIIHEDKIPAHEHPGRL